MFTVSGSRHSSSTAWSTCGAINTVLFYFRMRTLVSHAKKRRSHIGYSMRRQSGSAAAAAAMLPLPASEPPAAVDVVSSCLPELAAGAATAAAVGVATASGDNAGGGGGCHRCEAAGCMEAAGAEPGPRPGCEPTKKVPLMAPITSSPLLWRCDWLACCVRARPASQSKAWPLAAAACGVEGCVIAPPPAAALRVITSSCVSLASAPAPSSSGLLRTPMPPRRGGTYDAAAAASLSSAPCDRVELHAAPADSATGPCACGCDEGRVLLGMAAREGHACCAGVGAGAGAGCTMLRAELRLNSAAHARSRPRPRRPKEGLWLGAAGAGACRAPGLLAAKGLTDARDGTLAAARLRLVPSTVVDAAR